MLVYDSQRITDAERAQLIAYVSETVRIGRWHELKVPTRTTVTNLIDGCWRSSSRLDSPS